MSIYCYFPHSHFFFLIKKWALLTAAIQTIGKSEFCKLWLQNPWIAIFRQNDPKGIIHLRRNFQNDVLSSVLLFWGVLCRGCSWMKPQGASVPGGPWGEVRQAGGSAGWLQASRAVACRAHSRGGRTPRRAVLLPRLWERTRWLSQTQQTHFLQWAGRPHVSIVCSWVTAHTYFSRVLNGKKCVSLWWDVTCEGVRVSAWSASRCCGTNQGSDGYTRNDLPRNVQLHSAKIFWHNWFASQTWDF